MKLIDLLDMMAKGEKLPSKIRLFNEVFEYDEEGKTYKDKDGYSFEDYYLIDNLNDEIEQVEWRIEINNSMNITCSKDDMVLSMPSRKEKLKSIIEHYGLDKQLKYIHSEYFELDEAIVKSQYNCNYDFIEKEEDIKHIAEEIADVMVMLKQFQYYFDIKDEEIEEIMDSKIDRQLERIEKEDTNGTI